MCASASGHLGMTTCIIILLNAIYKGLLPSMILKSELQMWLNENNVWHCFVNGVTKHIFLNLEGLQNINLRSFNYQNVT